MFLNCHSYYSLRYGTMSIDELVAAAKANGVKVLGLTEINNSSSVFDFHKACLESDIHGIPGIEFRNKNQFVYYALAKNHDGLAELNKFLSICNINKKEFPKKAPDFEDAFVIYPFEKLHFYKDLKENEFIGISYWQLSKLILLKDKRVLEKLVISQAVTFNKDKDLVFHKTLRAVDQNILYSQLEECDYAHEKEHFISKEKLYKYFENYPAIIENTEKLASQCDFEFQFDGLKNKATFTGSKIDDRQLLEKLTWDGYKYRYGKSKEAEERVRKELKIIDELGYSAYFLITWDVIRYSMMRGFHHVGRGSGANSIVAYCLKITDVDPIDLDLYFERFINPKRSNPPDFDIDYSWKDRDEVIDYIFKRHGHEHTALLGTMSTFKGRSNIRELGKVFGLPKDEIDKMIKDPDNELFKNNKNKKIREYALKLEGFPNLRSIHAGGILISHKPIFYYSALDMPPKGFPTVQWDMYVAEDIGFEKLDILSQRGIGHLNECVEIVRENRGVVIDIHQVEKFKIDQKVRKQLKSGETIGCFYVESPAMRGLLKKLRCEDYLTLVAASSIIRPGVAKSGMMKEYIFRFHNPDKFKYLHPVMEKQLGETYGVMVYQEDVLKICHHYADLDLADADVLRRAMSGKHRSKNEFQRIIEKFFENAKKLGRPEEITKEVWRQIESFAGYSFSKAHSASFAVESFQSLYLKTYYPLEFMVSVINNFGGFYTSWVYFNEAKRWGANINLPCVNNSDYKTNIKGKEIYVGFIHVADLEEKVAKRLLEERKEEGDFQNLEDFINRVMPGIEQLIILIKIGAFSFTGKEKSTLLWEAHLYLNKDKSKHVQKALFQTPPKKYTLPKLEKSGLEDIYDEIQYLDFPVSATYFDLLKTDFRGEVYAENMIENVGKRVRMLGLLVTTKKVWTVNRDWMHFGTFLDIHGQFFDTVNFPSSLKNYPFTGRGVYLILGKITEEFGYPSMTVEKMQRLPIKSDPREV
jgi:DNA-directed DNA polymerase III PolC